ncbi:MAG: efflux RND transporter periplasmic adaptor subunit [Gammaproteobacteria bacterium]|nr:efflux RND transporter periplasmic adaptor subunit [Gammaproteobacteria bacterium]MDH4256091.1 efflux RND transporter periplasmic adaptor subunit [Gammaproteobacteria bacterium]MDH5310010.1 efflux RND transporter periplasmic adaptor subunit [Gammaproteobacteria bacterium]
MDTLRTGLATLLFVAAGALTGCGVGEAKSNGQAEETGTAALPVIVTSPETIDIYATYKTTANIVADSEAPLLARVSGEVVEILVEEGDLVSEGQLLARLDGDRLRLEMLEADAKLHQATRELERMSQLRERGLVSVASVDGLRYTVDSLDASYALKRLEYGYTEIRATIPGVVSSRDIKVGTQMKVGDTAFRITNTEKLVAYMSIPQTELGKFAVGHEATIRVDSMPESEFRATIARISPTIDARNGTFRATAYIDNRSGELAPGMFGRFTIAYDRHDDALVIPLEATLREDGETVVYIVRNGTAERRPIRTGIVSDGKVEVLSGLHAEEQVVLTGQSGLRDGSRVLASIGQDIGSIG